MYCVLDFEIFAKHKLYTVWVKTVLFRKKVYLQDEIFENAKPKMSAIPVEGEKEEKVIPYKIIATIEDDGLGPVGWWS